ncbi:hypothetical protein N7540_013046 [Penicillium herquei]|nr:hypothetical protein N7540_013046 [Penicillium herquei]
MDGNAAIHVGLRIVFRVEPNFATIAERRGKNVREDNGMSTVSLRVHIRSSTAVQIGPPPQLNRTTTVESLAGPRD